jgi:hypothetical protein
LARHVPQVVIAHDRGILRRLVGGKVRHETTVAEGGGVTVDDEHASLGPGQSDHLPKAGLGGYIAAEQGGLVAPAATRVGCLRP